jgi:hypothetical protein
MDLLINENQLKLILNEDLGVSMPSITYANLIYSIIEPIIVDFCKNKQPKTEEIEIGSNEISKIWKKTPDLYSELPISDIRILLDLVLVTKKLDLGYSSGGGAYPLDPKDPSMSYLVKPDKKTPKNLKKQLDDSLSARFDIDVFITKKFESGQIDELLYDVRDTIVHEMNHMVENYYRSSKGAKDINPYLSFSGLKNYNIPKPIWQLWDDFMTMVYYSEPHEVRAMSQEMYSFTQRNPIEKIKEHKYYVWANQMENFNAKQYYQQIIDTINEYSPKKLATIVASISKWFFRDYFNYMEEHGFTPLRGLRNETNLENIMIRLQPRIKIAGKQLKRNFVRLYSIEN